MRIPKIGGNRPKSGEGRRQRQPRSHSNPYDLIGMRMPKAYVRAADRELMYIKAKTTGVNYAGKVAASSLIITAITAFISFMIAQPPMYVAAFSALAFTLAHIVPFALLIIIADDRAKMFERNFPDALSMMSANLRAGMTIDKAIWSAARPEFGPLEGELHDVGKDVVGGVPISEALTRMGGRVRSDVVKQTMKLISEGIKSGGALESLLIEIAEDIRAMDILKEEVRANLAMYSLFILFASCIAGPIIYGVSSKFVDISIKLQKPMTADITAVPTMFDLKVGGISVSPDQVNMFYYSIIVVISFSASLIYGVLTKGEMKYGMKVSVMFLFLSLAVFTISRILVNSLFAM
jgi:pilus assembly protein TadC